MTVLADTKPLLVVEKGCCKMTDEIVLPKGRALLMTLPFCLPGLAMCAIYAALWGAPAPAQGFAGLFGSWGWIAACAVGVIVHEALHALTARVVGGVPASGVQFGVSLTMLAPYAHIATPMTAAAFRATAAAPGVLMGLLPFAIAAVIGQGALFAFATLFTFGAAGDFLILWVIRGVPSNVMVRDHPETIGVTLLDAAA